MSALAVALGAAAAAAGVTGSWSPCGFSMVDSLGRRGRGARCLPSCATFALGACVGGVATFAGLAAVGSALPGSGTRVAAGAAIAALACATWADGRALRIVPQIRRQVPEPWRRSMPLPLAASLYGVLLGMGFTTFVLSYAVWALAWACVTLGRPELGALVGLSFGLGRALPVVVLAPLADRPVGLRVLEAMAERPWTLRRFRLAAAVLLAAAATTLAAGGAARASSLGPGTTDPSFSAGVLAFNTRGGGAVRLGGVTRRVTGVDPAVGGGLLAFRDGDRVHVQTLDTGAPVADFDAPGANALAVSERWIVTRQRAPDGGEELIARPVGSPDTTSLVASSGPSDDLGRPALSGDLLAYHEANPRGSRIAALDLATGGSQTLRRSSRALLLNPSLLGGKLLYVRVTRLGQFLELGPAAPGGRDRVVLARRPLARSDRGYSRGYSHRTRTPRRRPQAPYMLWTTALGERSAYVTSLAMSPGRISEVLHVRR